MNPAQGSKTAQGYELQLGVNNIGTFLFTKLLTPVLISTATTLTPGSVRIVWVGSSAAELQSPKDGVPMTLIADRTSYLKNSPFYCYSVSKAGNFYHATEAARRLKSAGVVSVALNPGNLASELWRTQGSFADWLLRTFVLYPAVNGAYTELFAGLVEDVGAMLLAGNDVSTNSVTWVIPFGRIGTVSRKDMVTGTRTREEGGSGVAKDFWEWTEKQIEQYT
jgi:retinol dehydrogenase-12